MTFDQVETMLSKNPSACFGVGASEQEVEAAERALGVSISGDFRRFLVRFGWGGVGAFELYGLGADVPPYLNLVAMTRSERNEMRPRMPRHLLPIMNDGGGSHYCLDLRSDGPAIVFWDHEGTERQRPAVEGANFTDWLAKLVERLGRP